MKQHLFVESRTMNSQSFGEHRSEDETQLVEIEDVNEFSNH